MALTRKDAPIAGSDGGAGHSAGVARLIETCEPNEVGPHAHPADAIARIVAARKRGNLDDLLPRPLGPAAPRGRGA